MRRMEQGVVWGVTRVVVALGVMAGTACSDATPTDPRRAPQVMSDLVEASRLRVDQQNASNPSPPYTIAIGGNSNQRLLQSFTTGTGGWLRAIAVPVGCAPNAVVTLDVYLATDDGLPRGAALASTTIDGSRFPSTVGAGTPFTSIRVSEPLLRAHRRYAFVLSATGNSCAIVPALAGDTYPRGSFYFSALPNPPGWIPNNGAGAPWDLPFQTLMQVP